MKIAIVTHNITPGDGQGRVNYELIRELLQRGHQVTGLAHTVTEALQGEAGFTWIPVAKGPFPTNLIQGRVFGRDAAQWLRRHRSEYDIIHAHGWVSPEASDVNTSHFVHAAWRKSLRGASYAPRGIKKIYQQCYSAMNIKLERDAYQNTNIVVAISQTVRRELVAIGVPEFKIYMVYNGVDTNEFHPGLVDRRLLGLPENVLLALFVGDIVTSRKNLDTILAALVHVPDLHCVVVGAKGRSPYPAMADRLGLTNRVHFLGFRRDIAEIMRACDLFAFPSRYEACSLVLLEALSSGLPIVTAETAGGSEIVAEGGGIVLPNPNHVDDLAKSLNALASSDDLRGRMSLAARATSEKYSWRQMADHYVFLYQDVLSKRSVQAADNYLILK